MKCRKCGNEMLLDDVDFNFKGNKDNYWICENCGSSCMEQIRFHQTWKKIWHIDNETEVITNKLIRW